MSDRTTLADVAAEAGVSIATASRALAGRGDLSHATRRRVLTVARRLEYVRVPSAGGRPSGTARLVDLVLGPARSAHSDEVTAGARTAAARAGYDLVLTEERDSPDDDWPVRVSRRGSAGVVLGLISPTASQLAMLADTGIPVVLMDPRAESSHGLLSVRTTDREGGVAAATHLAARGATRFAVVLGSPPYRYGRTRLDGFREGLVRARPGAAPVVVSTDWSVPSTRAAMIPVLRDLPAGERLGVFASTDEMAAGVYAAAAVTGRRIPDEVLVVGFDDLPMAAWVTPPLTTVRQPVREMAAAAVAALVAAASGVDLPDEPIVLPTHLVKRGST